MNINSDTNRSLTEQLAEEFPGIDEGSNAEEAVAEIQRTVATLDAARLEAACKALALSDLQSRGPYSSDFRGEEQRQSDIEYANTRWREWQDDAEACIRAYLTPTSAEADEIARLRKGLQMIAYGATETSRGKGMWDMTNVYRVAEAVLNGEKPSYG